MYIRLVVCINHIFTRDDYYCRYHKQRSVALAVILFDTSDTPIFVPSTCPQLVYYNIILIINTYCTKHCWWKTWLHGVIMWFETTGSTVLMQITHSNICAVSLLFAFKLFALRLTTVVLFLSPTTCVLSSSSSNML
mgnify:CR=1 FL=1